MVRVFEDQILRGKDMSARAELARKVARMWEVELSDAREAADAWRRVLRMKQGDPEATAGLDRAKSNMLKTLDPSSERRPSAAPGSTETSEPTGAENTEVAVSHARAQESEDTPEPQAPEPARDDHAGPSRTEDTPVVASGSATTEGSGVLSLLESIADEDRTRFDQATVPALPAEDAFPKATPLPIDFSDATLPHAAAPPPTESELIIDVDASGEAPALDDEVLLADDLTEMVESDGDGEGDAAAEEPPQAPLPSKRSVPPPLPRGS
jgi:hypothetical protein